MTKTSVTRLTRDWRRRHKEPRAAVDAGAEAGASGIGPTKAGGTG